MEKAYKIGKKIILIVLITAFVVTYSMMFMFVGGYRVCHNMNSSLYEDYKCYKEGSPTDIKEFQKKIPFDLEEKGINLTPYS